MSPLDTSHDRLDRPGRLSADDRYELAAKAQHQQRLNYPTHLIALGLILVFASIVILAIAWQVRSSAHKAHLKVASKLVQIEQLVAEIQAIERAQTNDSTLDEHAPIPDMLSKFKRYASQAKLKNELGIPIKPTSRREGNARKMTYPYTVMDPSLEHLLDWVKISLDQTPGLEVTDLEIKPTKLNWTLKVTFTRYERIE